MNIHGLFLENLEKMAATVYGKDTGQCMMVRAPNIEALKLIQENVARIVASTRQG